jgi:hypothetical protein
VDDALNQFSESLMWIDQDVVAEARVYAQKQGL